MKMIQSFNILSVPSLLQNMPDQFSGKPALVAMKTCFKKKKNHSNQNYIWSPASLLLVSTMRNSS